MATKPLNPLAKIAIYGTLGVAAAIGINKLIPLLKSAPSAPASVPPPAPLPSHHDMVASPVTTIAPPTSERPGCSDKPEVRMLVWAWNAQQGMLFATGGRRAVEASLMCNEGINLSLTRQDAVDQMQAELIKCARDLASGKDDCSSGAHYVTIMGDGAGAFFAALNPQLAAVCDDCTAEVIGSAGYSRGEDKLMGPPAWRDNASSAAGGVVAGYLRDGDWNIAMKWAGDNALCNNPDETTYDPACLNWVAASDYIDASNKYITGFCEQRPVVANGARTGKSARVCVDGVVTWTPGDVNVAHKRGGLVSVASTREYAYQMPAVIIGLKRWNASHRAQVVGLLAAVTDGGQQVRQSPAARRRAAEISAVVYGEQDAAYWARYFDVVVERDATDREVTLGGSTVSNLADNQLLFGLSDGNGVERSIFAATYTVFGNIVVHFYPQLVPHIPPVTDVVNTSYLGELGRRRPAIAPAAMPNYAKVAAGDAPRQVVGRRNWSITFKSGSDAFTPEATKTLEQLYGQTVVTHTLVDITGHTDSDGDAEVNRELSRKRAFAVRDYLMHRSPVNFPPARFRVAGLGEDQPLVPNDSTAHKAANRRVEIVMSASAGSPVTVEKI